MSQQSTTEIPDPAPSPGRPMGFAQWMGVGWLVTAILMFALASSITYRPSFETGFGALVTVVAPMVLVGMVVSLAWHLVPVPVPIRWVGVAVAVGGWVLLVFDDDRWTILTLALYGVVFNTGRWVGVALAALISAGWMAAGFVNGAPVWVNLIPVAVFLIGSVLALTIYRSDDINTEQADLIAQLRATRRDLAAAERSKGVLEERARVAAEIHDTLAQGLTSIVLLSRAAMRSGSATSASLAAIEQTAQENLAAARRLVGAVRPPELESVSLPDALDRQVASSLPDDVAGRFRVIGDARPLSGAVEVILLRATQEALLNVRTHAAAATVDVTLSYLDDAVALDVRDDGVGFVPGTVRDRGSLTGGQGLAALEHRARSLDGELTIEAGEDGGSVLSVQLPVGGS